MLIKSQFRRKIINCVRSVQIWQTLPFQFFSVWTLIIWDHFLISGFFSVCVRNTFLKCFLRKLFTFPKSLLSCNVIYLCSFYSMKYRGSASLIIYFLFLKYLFFPVLLLSCFSASSISIAITILAIRAFNRIVAVTGNVLAHLSLALRLPFQRLRRWNICLAPLKVATIRYALIKIPYLRSWRCTLLVKSAFHDWRTEQQARFCIIARWLFSYLPTIFTDTV